MLTQNHATASAMAQQRKKHQQAVQNGTLIMNELNSSGDTPFVFNIHDVDDVTRANQFFDQKIAQGCSAYYIDPFDCKENEMTAFDPKAGRIIFVPAVQAGYPSPPED